MRVNKMENIMIKIWPWNNESAKNDDNTTELQNELSKNKIEALHVIKDANRTKRNAKGLMSISQDVLKILEGIETKK